MHGFITAQFQRNVTWSHKGCGQTNLNKSIRVYTMEYLKTKESFKTA